MKSVLGVFTCFNRVEKTQKCLESLKAYNPSIGFHFIAVDDCSTDGTAEYLQSRLDTTYLQGTGTLFYSGGMRKGMEAAYGLAGQYDYCLLFNDDVEFFEHSIERLAEMAEHGSQVLIGATCDQEGQLSYGGVCKGRTFKPTFQIVMSERGKRKICDTFNANCVLISSKAFLDAEPMDEMYTHSLGDFDYGMALKRRGLELVASDFYVGMCCDNPVRNSWEDASLPRWERIKKKETPKGLPYKEWFHFIRKNYSLPQAVFFTITPYLKILVGR